MHYSRGCSFFNPSLFSFPSTVVTTKQLFPLFQEHRRGKPAPNKLKPEVYETIYDLLLGCERSILRKVQSTD